MKTTTFFFLLLIGVSLFIFFVFIISIKVETENNHFVIQSTINIDENANEENVNQQKTNEAKNRNDQKEEKVKPNENNYKLDEDFYTFVQPTFVHPKLDTTKFNYEGECREPFKYKRNNKRDLLFHAYYFKDDKSWQKRKSHMKTTFEINKSGIPNATKVFFTYGDWENEEFKKVMKDTGYEIIKSDVELKKGEEFNVAVYRFFEFEKYLLKHKDEYDRVAITDVQDVYWFADGFQTIDPNELVVMLECDEIIDNHQYCRKINNGLYSYHNDLWIKECFGIEIFNKVKVGKPDVINSGFFAGSTEKMLEFLKVYNKLMKDRSDKLNVWGLDQSAINVAYHTGLLNHLNITLESFSQRMGNDMRGRFRYRNKEKILHMLNNQCSPVIRHKVERTEGGEKYRWEY